MFKNNMYEFDPNFNFIISEDDKIFEDTNITIIQRQNNTYEFDPNFNFIISEDDEFQN